MSAAAPPREQELVLGLRLGDLPPELLRWVFKSMKPIECCRLARVCMQWCSIIFQDSLWKEFISVHFDTWYNKLIANMIISAMPSTVENALTGGQNPTPAPTVDSVAASAVLSTATNAALSWKGIFFRIQEIHNNWKTATCRSRILSGFKHTIRQLQVQGNLLVQCAGPTIHVWNLQTSNTVFTVRPPQTHEVKSFQCVDATRLVCTAGQTSNQIHIYNPTTSELVHQYEVCGDSIQCLQYDYTNGNRLLTGGRQVCLWDLNKTDAGPLLTLKEQHRGIVNCIEIEDNLLVCTHKGKKIRIWDVRSGERLFTLQGHSHLIHTVGMNKRLLVSGSKDTTMRVWDVRRGFAERAVLRSHKSSVRCLEVDDWKVISGAKDASIYIQDLTQLNDPPALINDSDPIYSLASSDTMLFVGAGILKEYNFSAGKKSIFNSCSLS